MCRRGFLAQKNVPRRRAFSHYAIDGLIAAIIVVAYYARYQGDLSLTFLYFDHLLLMLIFIVIIIGLIYSGRHMLTLMAVRAMMVAFGLI